MTSGRRQEGEEQKEVKDSREEGGNKAEGRIRRADREV